ncbi:hypothetical protein [Streptomyces sp. NPDC056468]|uniref:hypothetical protein n=1 Tax=Streptomyces sp. NPDC056468 TaxID=3345830 RepID=UPI00368CFEC9
MVAGPDTWICADCVTLCGEILAPPATAVRSVLCRDVEFVEEAADAPLPPACSPPQRPASVYGQSAGAGSQETETPRGGRRSGPREGRNRSSADRAGQGTRV